MMIIYAVNGFRCEQFVFLFLNQFYETVENEFLLAQCYFLSIAAIKRESSEIFYGPECFFGQKRKIFKTENTCMLVQSIQSIHQKRLMQQ
mmetsp:Transcript_33135/g.40090  ORF Transcript_33135/g.40090 Transcript_33135/m.40090 type:complete len:90 (+) Transcript_33135:54-323(+)